MTDLESLVAPIALYPDPLLAELLVASTYPLEVVQAARWLETKPDLATLSSKDWDASIMRLTSVPQVVKMMNDHLDWTTQLGDVFLAKPADVMDAIQKLRKRATDSGFLKDTPEQKVTAKTVSAEQQAEGTWAAEATSAESSGATIKATPAVLKKEVITIQPAKTDTIYVPQYNPETVYQAPLAPPPSTGTSTVYPASTVVNVNQAPAPAPSYYPTYYPAPATTTTSSTDSWANFATGAVVGGLLTWGIMEWADDDDWDDYHSVGHYYGNTVCRNGNCWHGGGGGYYGDRGNINYNKNVNISGNEINRNRGGVFSQNNLQPTQRPAGWQPDQRHRRGQAYPEAVQQRLGRTQQPALAGQRLGAAQTLPSTARGFAEAGQRPAAGTRPAERRPSSADIREQLARKPGTQDRRGAKLTQPKPATRDIQGRLEQGSRDNALQGIKNSGQATRFESQRGSDSRKPASPSTRDIQARKPAGGERVQRQQIEKPRPTLQEKRPQTAQRQAEKPKQAARSQSFAGRERTQQQMATQRRSEAARPNAFEGSRNAGATRSFSQRGASSQQRSASAGNLRSSGGGGRSGGGGTHGGGGRSGGGGMRGGGGGRRR
ncbi:MAG: DUF3300 domain-containing protein [Methylococcales bacterium]|nr:DUF3300 domain-containing protein [Methylococcales bacterium]